MKELQVKGLSLLEVEKCKILRGGNSKTVRQFDTRSLTTDAHGEALHLIPTQRKNCSHPTLETVKSSLFPVSTTRLFQQTLFMD
ncbi:MAG: hypothetical protein EAZ76_14565 [Nostocales cyanobacterium]|nr:MAG: hypothetical protein EAZ87_23300 [Nostocales cyanobacterium]TAF12344.1 MAG: hypothetical protein EAZ76_14565 [Nostocales cyanobacterium]